MITAALASAVVSVTFAPPATDLTARPVCAVRASAQLPNRSRRLPGAHQATQRIAQGRTGLGRNLVGRAPDHLGQARDRGKRAAAPGDRYSASLALVLRVGLPLLSACR